MPTSEIDVFIPTSKPQALILIFGWFGSHLRHVKKYSALYHARGCATITGVADSCAIIRGGKPNLDQFALEVAQEAIKILRSANQDLPVITHVFSNGGSIPLSRLETLIHKANRARAEGTMTHLDKDLILLGNAMRKGGQIFDSSPCYPHFMAGIRGIGGGIQNSTTRFIAQCLFVIMIIIQTPLIWLSCESSFIDQFWFHVMHRPIAFRQAYVYSAADRITDCDKLEALIAFRQHTVGSDNILVKKLVDSKHVLHLRQYPAEYEDFIDEMLDRVKSGPPLLDEASDREDDKEDWEDEHIILGGAEFRL